MLARQLLLQSRRSRVVCGSADGFRVYREFRPAFDLATRVRDCSVLCRAVPARTQAAGVKRDRLSGRRNMKISGMLMCGLLAGVAVVGAEDQGEKKLAARVQRLEDQEEIRMLLVIYGPSLDARDFAKYASLFAKDGEWTGGFGTAKGPAAIKAMMDKDI